MKKIILILVSIFISLSSFAQLPGCGTNTMCLPFSNTDQFQIYQAIKDGNNSTTVSINCNTCISTVKQSTVAGSDFTVRPTAGSIFTVAPSGVAGSEFSVRPTAGTTFTVRAVSGSSIQVDCSASGILASYLNEIQTTSNAAADHLNTIVYYGYTDSKQIWYLEGTTPTLLYNAFTAWKSGSCPTCVINQISNYWDGTKHQMFVLYHTP